MEIGSLEWYKEIADRYSVSTISSYNERTMNSSDVRAYIVIDRVQYLVPMKELEKFKI